MDWAHREDPKTGSVNGVSWESDGGHVETVENVDHVDHVDLFHTFHPFQVDQGGGDDQFYHGTNNKMNHLLRYARTVTLWEP